MNSPIWLPSVATVRSRSSSGWRSSRVKNSMTPITRRLLRTGNASMPRRSSRALKRSAARRWVVRQVGNPCGLPSSQTRPGRPAPRGSVISRVTASKSRSSAVRVPDGLRAKDGAAAVHVPEDPDLPAEILADGLQDRGTRLLNDSRLRHHTADIVLDQDPPFLLPARGDIEKGDYRATKHSAVQNGRGGVLHGEARAVLAPEYFVLHAHRFAAVDRAMRSGTPLPGMASGPRASGGSAGACSAPAPRSGVKPEHLAHRRGSGKYSGPPGRFRRALHWWIRGALQTVQDRL